MTTVFSSIAANQKIDADTGLISRVSVITEGDALGHGIKIDETTLSQVLAQAKTFSSGVKVKMNHGGGVDSIIGILKNFSIEGKQLFADLQLLKSSGQFGKIVEMAQTMPESFGLSISFSGEHELIDKVKFARCSELYSVDLVDSPAANPKGLFSAQVDCNTFSKEQQFMFEEIKNLLKQSSDKIAGLSANRTPVEVEQLQSQIADLNGLVSGELTTTKADLATAKATIGTLNSNLEKAQCEVNATGGALKSACSSLKLQVKEGASSAEMITALQDGVSATLAKLNISADKIPGAKPSTSAQGETKTKTRDQYQAMNPREAMAFFQGGGKIVD